MTANTHPSLASFSLLSTLISHAPFDEQFTDFVLSSSISLAGTSCLVFIELNDGKFDFLSTLADAVLIWHQTMSEERRRAKAILARLVEEGFFDESELFVQSDFAHPGKYEDVRPAARLTFFLGGNQPFLSADERAWLASNVRGRSTTTSRMSSKLDNVIPPGYSKPKKISEGAFGQVLKVLHERSEIEYAMKVLPMLKEGDKERVSREVDMLTRFAHPRIVGLHESIDMGGHYAIVMELGTRRSTAHGDLKPENVLLRVSNRAFLCDLGGSVTLEQHLTQTTGEFGTFEYNSPERMMDSKGTATPASDVWSLGVLAYRMVTGKSLFEGLHLFQMTVALHTFDENKIPLSIDPHVRGVLLKMLEPNVTLRATTSALFEGALLERMLGPETALSKMKDIQLATRVNEIKLSSCDAKLKERTMELEMEKQTLMDETKELENRLRSLQMSVQRTCERNAELEREEELEQHQNLLATHTAPVPINPEDNVISTNHEMPVLLFRKDEKKNTDETSFFDVSGNKITRTGFDMDQNWSTTLFEEQITEGVVSVAITVLAIPKDNGSIALAPVTGTLHATLPSNNQRGEKTVLLSAPMADGDRMMLEVDMDARPRTAVFIVNGNVPLTFVSGLPPSIRFGLSMKNEGVSVRFDGISRLKQATPLRRVNEIKWNAEDLKDSEDLYMNGLRASVLTVHKQMPSLVFTNPSHFRVEDKRITSTEPISEGIVALTFTIVMDLSSSSCGLIDGTARIPEKGEKLGKIENSIALFSRGELQPLTEEEQKKIDLSLCWQDNKQIVVELNMDSNPRTAQFFIDNKSVPAVVVDLPESVRVGFSAKGPGLSVRFDRITQLNRGSPITDQMNEIEWPTAGPLQAKEVDEDSVGNDEARKPEKGKEKVSLEAENVNDDLNQEIGKSEEHEEDGDHPTRESDPKDKKTKENRVSDEDTDEENSHSDSDDDKEDDRTDVGRKKRHLPTMKLPQLLFTDKSHFIIRNNVLTRTEKGTDKKERTRPSTVLFSDPITQGVVSVTFIVLAVAESVDGFINFGLLDAQTDVPRLGRVLGKDVKHSIALSTRGEIHVFCLAKLEEKSHYFLSRKDRVVMEVNMESNPRTVQFFVNGKTAACYVSGIPESVRIGFSADVLGTSLEIASIVHSTQATPLEPKMKEIKWTDTEQSLNERSRKQYHSILREAKGSMPALLSRNPDHFQIEGNVITHKAFGCNGLTSPFSTVMFRNVGMEIVRYVAITILALPQTEHLDGVVLIGCLRNRRLIPKSPKGLGIQKKWSFALCSSDGMIQRSEWGKTCSTPCHSILQVGDKVVMEVNTRSPSDITRFYVNGKAGQNEISKFSLEQMIGFSLAGPGTSIRIDAFKSHIKPLQDIASLADVSQTILNFPNAPFDLMVMNAFTGEEFTFNVYPQHTILQIKLSLAPRLSRSIENIELMFEADTLDDSTKLSEIAFNDRCALIAFINDPDDTTTITVHDSITEDQPLTALPLKETIDEMFDLIVKGPSTGEEFALNVHPQNTILQIKQLLIPQLNVPFEDISFFHKADKLTDSTSLSEIDFCGDHIITAFIDEPDDPITVTVHSDNTEEQPSTQSPLKEIINDEFELIVTSTSTGDEYTLRVHSQNTILQIKYSLARCMNLSIEDISLCHKTDDLKNSTTLSDIDFNCYFSLLAFINEQDDLITVTVRKNNTGKQPPNSSQSMENVDDEFDLVVLSASTGERITLNVRPHTTILQIKQLLIPQLNVPFEVISLFHKADKLNDSSNLSEIYFDGHYVIIAFINESDYTITVANHENNTEEQSSTAVSSKENVDDEFDLMVHSATTGDQFTLRVHPRNTILQIKQLLVPQLNVPFQNIELMSDAGSLNDSATLSEINFNGHYVIIAFINEPDDSITNNSTTQSNMWVLPPPPPKEGDVQQHAETDTSSTPAVLGNSEGSEEDSVLDVGKEEERAES
ncbi:hypothetical protein BLNAU_24199 [Blattamonas nauphoetae]|uniref:Uncharacterized protein n=1 Tax=Blattamonas nauphoetae TaxID=2049346 RepID=A0ABQ9WN38_9EUKA|nr:hypothetical protein BLNAU_24199 [Blattamonas nauphoetae]